VGLGEIHTIDEAPIVREMQGLIGPLSDDEAALVRALTPADLSWSEMVQHMFELVDLLVLAGAISTAVERHELARAA
jgi:hypothetical protein